MIRRSLSAVLLSLSALCASAQIPVTLGSGWQLQDVAKVPEPGAVVSSASYNPAGWYAATVPGTVLTSLVNDGIYPEPTYGENERPESIPESIVHTSYWYRTTQIIPASYAGKHIWLNFDGINFDAAVWVNGVHVGSVRGAFIRGRFDITPQVKPGSRAVIAVLITPQPHPGVPHEHTLTDGVGKNGGIAAIDGPVFQSTIGWDWLAAVRDRDTGIWQKVFFSATGNVTIKDPLVITDLPLPRTDSTDVTVQARVENITGTPQKGVLQGSIGSISFSKLVEIAPSSSQIVSFDAKTTPALHILKPKLWWPNGYGPQSLYKLHLSFVQQQKVSDASDITFGVRKITYAVPDSDNLTVSVNGVRIFIRGGDWGLDEALKRVPRERLEAQIRMHALANLNLIRNWVGQSTSEDFYELCDKYGILLWDEFFQSNPSDGPNPDDTNLYIANVRDKILRFRNHPSIAIWCARNEGYPPENIDAALRILMKELEPTRLYQPSSTEGRGVMSGGPYSWREPREFYKIDAAFKTETGSISVPTLESVHGMMPQKDWESINDDWAQHDFAKGAQKGDLYPGILAKRYGAIANLADFVRKAQLMNYEAFRAMYEGREAGLFHPATGIITWMSHPAQPSFVWQLYHYDLEPNASLFAVKKAGEMLHIQLNQSNSELQVINNGPTALQGASAKASFYNLDGKLVQERNYPVTAVADAATNIAVTDPPISLTTAYIVKLELDDASGKLISDNVYWSGAPGQDDDLTALDKMPRVILTAKSKRTATGVSVTLSNPTPHVALMTHVQLRRSSGERILPAFYSDNYISLMPGESRTITIEANSKYLQNKPVFLVVDGWNVSVAPTDQAGVMIAPNIDANVDHWPVTGLPFQKLGLR